MIIEKGYYHPDNGYWQVIIETDIHGEDAPNLPEGTIEVPLKPSALHTLENGEWISPTQEQLDIEKANVVRAERDFKLQYEIDPIVTNPLRWADLSTEQQQKVKDYRQALLDITDQSGFPHDVQWPEKIEF